MNAKEILNSLKEDIRFYEKYIKEVANDILDGKYTEYPLFIAHQHEVALGECILDKDDFDRKWSIHATTLEELVEKGIITEDKVSAFKDVYKDPRKNICIFLITELGGNFVFMPYKEDESNRTSATST